MRDGEYCQRHGWFPFEALSCEACVQEREDEEEDPVRLREVEAHRVAAATMDLEAVNTCVRVMGAQIGDSTHYEIFRVYQDEARRREAPGDSGATARVEVNHV